MSHDAAHQTPHQGVGSPSEPEEALQRALELGYRHLGRRDRTATELRGHLLAKEIAPETADAAVAELERQGYVDDARFALLFAEDRRALDGWGSQRIEQRLTELGIAREHVDAAVAQRDRDAELDAATGLLRQRFPAPPQDARECDRALRLLVRRGYELELAHEAIRAVARSRL